MLHFHCHGLTPPNSLSFYECPISRAFCSCFVGIITFKNLSEDIKVSFLKAFICF